MDAVEGRLGCGGERRNVMVTTPFRGRRGGRSRIVPVGSPESRMERRVIAENDDDDDNDGGSDDDE